VQTVVMETIRRLICSVKGRDTDNT